MSEASVGELERLFERLGDAVGARGVEQITAQVKQTLEDSVRANEIPLPDSFRHALGDCYARRLLHRDTRLGYTVVVMAWGPGQRTRLHDHAGLWCVECVVEGELNVTQFDLTDREQGRYRFVELNSMRAGVGDAGCLIPPSEYHVMHNPREDATTITLHVYGGEMQQCNLYVPAADGWWDRQSKSLQYDN
jgi:predicted metal-dependent enzyme (double-stranded beta helix superfamily)